MKKVILLIVVLFPLVLFAQNNDTIISKKQYIETVKRVNNLENRVNTDQATLEKAQKALEISEKYSSTADRIVNLFTILILALGVIAGFFGISSFFTLPPKVQTHINKRMVELLDRNKKSIIELFQKHEYEKAILENTTILLLNKDETDVAYHLDTTLRNFSKEYEPKNIPVDLISYNLPENIIEYDVVVFDNTNSNSPNLDWDFDNNRKLKNKLIEIVQEVCSHNIAFFFNGTNDGQFKTDVDAKYRHLINFSNWPANFFANLIDLLSLRKLLSNS